MRESPVNPVEDLELAVEEEESSPGLDPHHRLDPRYREPEHLRSEALRLREAVAGEDEARRRRAAAGALGLSPGPRFWHWGKKP